MFFGGGRYASVLGSSISFVGASWSLWGGMPSSCDSKILVVGKVFAVGLHGSVLGSEIRGLYHEVLRIWRVGHFIEQTFAAWERRPLGA